MILLLRDEILRMQGFAVNSTTSHDEGENLFLEASFDLVVVDVERQGRVARAEEFCQSIRAIQPKQKVVFVCNYMVSIETDCPDEIINADFNPAAFLAGVRRMLE